MLSLRPQFLTINVDFVCFLPETLYKMLFVNDIGNPKIPSKFSYPIQIYAIWIIMKLGRFWEDLPKLINKYINRIVSNKNIGMIPEFFTSIILLNFTLHF